VLDVTADGLAVREIFTDLSFDELRKLTGVPLIDATRKRRPERQAGRRARSIARRPASVDNSRTPFSTLTPCSKTAPASLPSSAAPSRSTDLVAARGDQRMLDVEAALARALAAQRVIPAAAVAPIERACDAGRLDGDALAQGAALGGNLAIPLVKQLTALVKADDPEAAKFVHWGATSQDIIDTATVLQLRDALDVLEPLLDEACASLATLARASRDADDRPHVAAAGAPITLGLKFAQWLDALLRHRTRFARCANALVLQFGGAAGTLASLRERRGPA
jgi:hypothetical protein